MWKKKKIDFVLYEDDDEMIVFRFRPRQSNCHSFNENPPESWREVYKVYYSYVIYKRWKDDNFHTVLFDCYCDECSIIDVVASTIKRIVNGEKTVATRCMGNEHIIELLNNEIMPFGVGVSWIINECRQPDLYEFVLWDWCDKGYRFYLEKDKMKEFGEYLNECCEYMLAHGDPN